MWNKRAEGVMSIYDFLIWTLIAAGIFAMVYIFYGTPFDIRELESRVLINKIADCVSYAGRINSNVISEGNFQNSDDFLHQCHFILSSEEWEEEQFYIEINFYTINDLNNSNFSIKKGNTNLASFCSVQEQKEEKNFPKCNDRTFYSVDNLNNQYLIKILTAVKKTEKNVKM